MDREQRYLSDYIDVGPINLAKYRTQLRIAKLSVI